jgi:outer membrane immunogenic protein
MKYMVGLAVGIAAFATPAAAQTTFDGFRVEARLGYDSQTLDADYDDFNSAPVEAENNEDGLGFGGEVGYDFGVAPGFILGVYGGVDFSDTDFCRIIDEVEQVCFEARRNWYLGARAGVQAGGSTLIYGKFGWSNANLRLSLDDVQNVIDDLNDSDTQSGLHFGVGIEQNFGPMFYGKLEYVYTVYSDVDFSNVDAALSIDGRRSQVMLGAGLRF